MTRSKRYGPPTTVRLTTATRALLGTRALLDQTTRSALVRELIDEGLAARARKPPPPPSARIESRATGPRHMVTIEFDTPADRDPSATKDRIATRNAAMMNPRCECGATLQELDSQPLARSRVSASVSAAQPVPASEQRFGKLIPSVSPARPPARRGRATITLEMTHKPGCPGANPT
jgi:hypothetical protein